MNVSAGAFRDQIAWLADTHPVITVEQALDGVRGVAITFDDGYRDNLMNAQPVLERHGAPWTLFFVAGLAGKVLAHGRDPGGSTLLTWDEIRHLRDAGVEIGGHTMTHARLSSLAPEDQRREIVECRRLIEAETGESPAGFAYPYGSLLDYTDETVAIVQEAGFRYALSNRYGAVSDGDRWKARRIWIDRTDSLDFFRSKVEGRLDRLRLLDSGLGIRARRMVRRLS